MIPPDSTSPWNPLAWKWKMKRPNSWRPTAVMYGSIAKVSFYTHTALYQERITHYIDTFRSGSYRFKTKETIVGLGMCGFEF